MKRITLFVVGIFILTSFSTGTGSLTNHPQSIHYPLFSEQQHRISPLLQVIHQLFEKIHDYQKLGDNVDLQHLDCEKGFVFSPKPITLSDDSYHGANTVDFTEWWYFDALLNDGYSIQMIFQVIGLLNQSVLSVKMNMYQNGKLTADADKIYFPNEFFISKETPLIKINGKQVMKGYIDQDQWIYDITLDINDVAAEVRFVGSTIGWKGVVPLGEWAVIMPKADVSGTVSINKKQIAVSGTGYHDHNWDLTAKAGLQYFGWFWGKITTDTTTVVWSSLLNSMFEGDPILVINKGTQQYQSIDSSHIQFTTDDFSLDNGKLIPHKFVLRATADTISLSLTMNVETIQHVKVGTINYWRYHVHCLGSITVDSQTEIVDQMQIAEFMRF